MLRGEIEVTDLDTVVPEYAMAARRYMGDEMGSQFVVEAIARPNVKLETLEKAIDAELAKVRKDEVSQAELARAQNQYEMSFFTQLQSVNRRASLLNASNS